MSGRMRVGWCPSLVTPMAAADGLLVRVKPTAATIPAAALAALADAAARHGNGLIDLTNRSNLQMRGLRPDTVAPFAEIARAHGLAAAEPALEEVRNVAADPLGPDDPDAAFDSHAIARGTEAMLAAESRLATLPPKFGFVVDCGGLLPIPDARADILIRARDGRLTVSLDGGAAALPCAPDEAPEMARRLALAFLDLAGPPDAPPYRMRELVALAGEGAIFEAAGVEASATVNGPSPVILAGARQRAEPGSESRLALMYAAPPAGSPVGFLPFPGRDSGHTHHPRSHGAFVAGVPRGRIEAAVLAEIAGLAERFADATVRTTPWRALVLAPVATAQAEALSAALRTLGLITDPADPRRALRGFDIEPAGETPAIPEVIAP